MNKLNPLIPMLAITGKPSEKRIKKILKEYNSVNINQIMLYPRSGCELEYMSSEWFDTLEFFIIEGRKYNMQFWLYDEMNWPSGSCNGLVTKNPSFKLKALTRKNGVVKVVSSETKWESRGCPDTLCDEAVNLFINNTHKLYKDKLGKYFGKEILGIFTDEPGYIYESWAMSKDFSESFPYYVGMEDDFKNYTGGSDLFEEYLLADKMSFDFYETIVYLLKERFKNNFLVKIRCWCEENNLIFTGHLFNESQLYTAVQCNGNIIEQMQAESMPGMDDIWTRTYLDGIEWDTMSALNTAIIHNKKGGMAELFALGPCDMPFSKLMRMVALCSAHKIDHYFLAVCPVDLRGNVIKDVYFNIFTEDQPWFDGLKCFNEFAVKCSDFAKKEHVYNISILYPYKDMSRLMGDSKRAANLSDEFTSLLRQLVKNQISFKFITDFNDDNLPVFYYENGELKVKDNNVVFNSNNDAIKWIKSNCKIDYTFTDDNGNPCDNLFVRVSVDDEIMIVDLDDKRTEYNINICKNKTTKHLTLSHFYLGNFKDIVGEKSSFANKIDEKLDFINYNLTPFRPFFKKDNKLEFFAEKDFDVKVLIRNYNKAVKVIINGEELYCEGGCTLLNDGMKEFYKECDYKLKKGSNVIVSDIESEINYLPSVIIFGDFEVVDNNLKIKTDNFDKGKVFYGKAEFSFSAKVPSAKGIQLKVTGNNYYSKLYINGDFVSESVLEPLFFDVPDKYTGQKCKFSICYYSSISGVMGNIHDVLEGFESSPDLINCPSLYWVTNKGDNNEK